MNVIVHGGQGFAADWGQVKALLGPTEVPERRGRNGVPLPGDYGLRTEIDDLHGVLDRHENVTLVGHSYGGLIAWLTAQERDDLAALVLYEPVIYLDAAALEALGNALSSGDRDLALEIVVSRISGEKPFRDADPERWLRAQDLLDTTFRELTAAGDYRYQPAKLQVPVTVVVGERTEPFFGPGARDIVRDTSGKLVTLNGEGHLAHRTNPALLAATIREGSTTLSG